MSSLSSPSRAATQQEPAIAAWRGYVDVTIIRLTRHPAASGLSEVVAVALKGGAPQRRRGEARTGSRRETRSLLALLLGRAPLSHLRRRAATCLASELRQAF